MKFSSQNERKPKKCKKSIDGMTKNRLRIPSFLLLARAEQIAYSVSHIKLMKSQKRKRIAISINFDDKTNERRSFDGKSKYCAEMERRNAERVPAKRNERMEIVRLFMRDKNLTSDALGERPGMSGATVRKMLTRPPGLWRIDPIKMIANAPEIPWDAAMDAVSKTNQ